MVQKSGFRSYLGISILIFICCIFLIANVTASEVAMFRGDPQHTGVYELGASSFTPELLWKFPTDGPVISSPVVADDIVYVGGTDSQVYAIDAISGNKVWNFSTDGPVYSSPAIVNNLVFVGSTNKIYAIGSNSGVQQWKIDEGSYSSPSVSLNNVYMGSTTNQVKSINSKTLSISWSTTTNYIRNSPGYANGKVYVTSISSTYGYGRYLSTQKIDAVSGKQDWNTLDPSGEIIDLYSPSPVIGEQLMYAISTTPGIDAVYLTNSSIPWTKYTGAQIWDSPILKDGNLYFGDDNNKFYSINAENGKDNWNITLSNQIRSSPIYTGGKIYVWCMDGKLYEIDPVFGGHTQIYDLKYPVRSSPVMKNGIMYVGCDDGFVYALGSGSQPTTGSISVSSLPSGAQISLDGSSTGYNTPYVLTGLTPGQHAVLLKLSGYQDFGQTVTVTAGQTTSISAPLTPTTGIISLSSSPSGAQIYLDGNSTSHITPYTLTGITTGQRAVTLKLNGYQDFSQNVTVTSGQTTTITAILSPIVTTGSISISSTPTGAQIYLDGSNTNHNSPYTLTGITTGQHAVTLKLNGYQDYNQNVTVIAGLIALVNATLTPTTGAISFSSIPGGAQIYLGGNNSGHTTPYTLTGISPGMNPTMLKLNGYQDYNQNVTVVAGQTAVVNVTLSPEGWTPITAPCIISTPGHYRLTNNLTNSTAETGIWIQSSDVFLSGDGHTLNGISADNTTGVLASKEGVTISNITMVNLSVTGWESGFKVFGVEHGGLLWSCSATGNNRGVLIAESPYFTMGLCTVEDNIPYIDHGISMGGTGVTLTNSSGTYILDSNISHNGWGDNLPFVGGYGILLNDCPGVLVENCTINKNINTGIWNDQSPGMRVIRNEFHDNSGNGGIFMTARDEAPVMSCTIQDNRISGSGWGIFLRNNDYLVKNNLVSGCGYGILLESSQNATLLGNTLNNNDMNLAVNGQNEEDYHHQIDTTNTVNGKPVYYLVGQTGAVIDRATNAGVVFGISCPDLTVRDLELRHNEFGVFLIGSDRAMITNVTAIENTMGFNILSSNAVLLDHCTATLNPINGIKILNSNRVLVRNSDTSDNNDPAGAAGTGISIQNSSSFRMENVASRNNSMFGIELDNADQVDIRNATVNANSEAGIVVKGDTIQITGSRIRDNEGPGIGLLDSNNITIWNNYFSNNENVGISEAIGTGNTWNITKTTGTNIVNGPYLGGNYWAKPDGTGWSQVTPDRGDGFCSAPFVIDGNNTDYLPLHIIAPPPSDYNITLGEGWNMVSVPKKLAPGYDTGSIFGNVTTEGRTIWEYDGSIHNWVPVHEDTRVLPLYGFWIYSKYLTTVPLKFDPNPLQVPPTRKLVKGWELIGFTGTIPASARDTLISVRNNWTQAMGFNTTAYQYDIQIINGGSGPFTDSRLMYATKGYWLYMTGPGDLAAIGV